MSDWVSGWIKTTANAGAVTNADGFRLLGRIGFPLSNHNHDLTEMIDELPYLFSLAHHQWNIPIISRSENVHQTISNSIKGILHLSVHD